MSSSTILPGITLLICTHNGTARLPILFRHIALQQVAPDILWEVLVISNASADDTITNAKELATQLLPKSVTFRVLDEPQLGKEHALTLGLDQAQYEAVAIVDDDNLLASDYVQTAFEVMRAHSQIGILGARALGAFEVSPPEWFAQLEAVYAVGEQNGGESGQYPANTGHVYGAGSVVRRSGWLQLRKHGFRFLTQVKRGAVLAGGEDIELGEALRLAGYELWYDDRLRFHHYMYQERLTWSYLLRIGIGAPAALLTSIVYYFVLRHPNLSLVDFYRLYAKRIAWLTSQLVQHRLQVAKVLRNSPSEGNIAEFEAMRLVHNIRITWANRAEAVRLFREVRSLQQRLQKRDT